MGLTLRQASLTWPSSKTRACVDVSLNLHSGSIHALVGENGAGKTSLGHILAGVQIPDSGTLLLDGQCIELKKNKGKIIPGIGLVRQRSVWPPTLKLWEAIIIGCAKRENPRLCIRRFKEVSKEWKIHNVDPLEKISKLNTATLQRAQLLAALSSSPRFLVLDEPFTVWKEDENFSYVLKECKRREIGVLLITHHIEDVLKIADSVTVMRSGHVVISGAISEFNTHKLSSYMFGKSTPPSKDVKSGELRNKPIPKTDKDSPTLRFSCKSLRITASKRASQINFQIYGGEIFAITGIKEELIRLEQVISGEMAPIEGTIELEGYVLKKGFSSLRDVNVGYVPSDSIVRGASLHSSVAENMMILESARLSRSGWLHPKTVRQWALNRCQEGGIQGLPNQKMSELSGGNIQKLVLQREMNCKANFLLLVDPSLGLDEQSSHQALAKLRSLAHEGKGILILSSDMDEALRWADYMAILNEGSLSTKKSVRDWDKHEAAMYFLNVDANA